MKYIKEVKKMILFKKIWNYLKYGKWNSYVWVIGGFSPKRCQEMINAINHAKKNPGNDVILNNVKVKRFKL